VSQNKRIMERRIRKIKKIKKIKIIEKPIIKNNKKE
jgi:hypothetical protein